MAPAPFRRAASGAGLYVPDHTGSVSLPATGLAELSPQFNVSTRLGCAWTARSNVPWIRVSFGQSGNGNGTVGITADINREAVARSGSLTIAGQTISIQQAAANCTFLLNPSSATASPAGGTSVFQVNTTCAWQVVTNVDWIAVTSPSGGAGLGTNVVTYVVQANGGASRTGTIQVGPVRFTVNQPAGACIQTLNPMQVDLPATGGNGTVQVTSNCTWTAVSNDAWITITGGASANRDGTLSYSVQANPLAPSRSGTIRIGNQTFTVNQAGVGCTVTLDAFERKRALQWCRRDGQCVCYLRVDSGIQRSLDHNYDGTGDCRVCCRC
jgi:hypothetical protein